jgi:hypothetical protein
MIIKKSIFKLLFGKSTHLFGLFSVEKSISEETFGLIMRRLQQKAESSKKIGNQLI